jgi:polysaccharide pyruvyl transferase WcaK-like protein/glycosyltransferase involved in cell wall biosynthesis
MHAPAWAGRVARVLPDPRRDDATLVLPPTHPGSVGDEAMMMVCMDHLMGQGRRFAIADFAPGDRWPGEPPGTAHVDLSGFFGARHLRSMSEVAQRLRGFGRLWCLGADVIDGHYSEVGSLRRVSLVRLAAEIGLEASILGFSFNESPSELVVEALQGLPASVRLNARDPRSHTRLLERLGRPVDLVADLAFGLSPASDLEPQEEEIVDWVRAHQTRGQRVVGLNVSHRAFKSTGHADVWQAVEAYALALTDLLERRPEVSLLCIPHDYRGAAGEMSDPELLAAIAAKVRTTRRDRILVPEPRLSAPFVKRLAGEVDAVLSGRMHLVIAALGQGTPASGLSYQGKLAGLYELFELPELGVDPADALTTEGLRLAFDRLLDDHALLSAQIEAQKPGVFVLQHSNLEPRASAAAGPRLLVLSPEPTHPTNKGNRMRIMDLCDRAEHLGWEVHLAHAELTKADRAAMAAHWGARYHPLPYRYPVSAVQKAARRLRGVLTGNYEIGIDDWYDEGINPYLRALHDRYAFDAVMIEYAHQSRAFDVFEDGPLKILDTHDELAHRFARQVAFGQRRTGFSTTPEQEAIAIQDLERERFRRRTRADVVTVGHHVPSITAPPKPFEGRLMFLGSRNQANVDAIEYFLQTVWPRVSSTAKLLIAGSICEMIDVPAEVEQKSFVPDLSDAYDPADIVIVPVRFGTGLKIKTIEALGRGKPVVSTRVGAEGLEHGHGTAILVADDAEAFAAAIRSLIDDDNRRQGLARAGAELARAWNAESEAAFAGVLARAELAQAAD